MANQARRTKELVLELYNPHPVQLAFHSSEKRYRIIVTGRQCGKSTMANQELLKRAWENPKHHLAFISPIYSQSKEQFRRLVASIPPGIIARKSDSELRIDFINGSIVEYLSGDNPDNIRGRTLHGVVIDEMRDQSTDLWSMVVRPMLATTKGWAAMFSTPNGFDQFYDLFEIAKTDQSGEWFFLQAPSTANPLFSQTEADAARRIMSEAEFDQEINANFRDISQGKTYLSHGSHNHVFTSPFTNGEQISPFLPIIVGCDFNVGLLAFELMQHKDGVFYVFDEIALRNSHTQEAARLLANKIKGHAAGAIIIGDATGKARKTSAAGETDYTFIMNELQKVSIKTENRTPDSNPLVRDRVNIINSKLRNANGQTSIFYNPERCPELKKDFDRVVWRQGAGNAILDQVSDRERTHASDAFSYPIYELAQSGERPAGLIRILR